MFRRVRVQTFTELASKVCGIIEPTIPQANGSRCRNVRAHGVAFRMVCAQLRIEETDVTLYMENGKVMAVRCDSGLSFGEHLRIDRFAIQIHDSELNTHGAFLRSRRLAAIEDRVHIGDVRLVIDDHTVYLDPGMGAERHQ